MMAQFQAAGGTLRDASIREWVLLEDDDKRHLISFCLCCVFKYASSPEGYVISKNCFNCRAIDEKESVGACLIILVSCHPQATRYMLRADSVLMKLNVIR
ncbi:unnamed protein product [Cuscuta campestris]|uniref:Uncharacterized protein n=1 Tax=Cuscuta campestris TaxID=132261 RepID=A0A484LZF1_9ASTE|nr:unnamed protein product [Cuscuta campestris]